MGEFELLARIRERLPADSLRIHLGSGDDASIVVPGGATATSVDAVVEGVHFSRETATPAQIGHKALATALSDLAAMGAEAGEAYVALGVPSDLDEDGCIELLDGLLALAAATGTTLAGGDVTRAGELFLAITVVGHARAADSFVKRSGAQPGDTLVLSGEIGGAVGGLLLLEKTGLDETLSGDTGERLRARQLEPQPRLGAGRALGAAGATAMIDLSDGLGGDAGHLAESSGIGIRIDATALPLALGIAEIASASGQDRFALTVSGGEDYELLASIAPERFERAAQAVRDAEGIALTQIGEVVTGSGVEIRLPDGRLVEPEGFDQLA
jgi:thiamine-monophosphate kinase